MARTTNKQPDQLVMIHFGWYGKFILPVDAAASIVNALVSSGAVKVTSDHIEGISRSVLRPEKNEWGVQPIDGPYLADCPVHDEQRKPYFDWLRTKAQLVGNTYEPESYAAFCDACHKEGD